MSSKKTADVSRLLVRAFLFLMPLVCAWLFLEVQLGKVVNSHSIKKKGLEERLSGLECVVMGNSQALYGVNPDLLTVNAFNLAHVSQSIYYDVRLVCKYLSSMPDLKCVVLPISYFSLGSDLAGSREEWRQNFYSHYWGIKPQGTDLLFGSWSKVRLYGFKSSLEYAWKSFDVSLAGDVSSLGWCRGAVKKDVNLSDSSVRKRVAEHAAKILEENYFRNIKDISVLLDELRRRNIKTVFIVLPVYGLYRNHQDVAVVSRNRAIINDLSTMYGCLVLDYEADDRFGVEDFGDADHLNAVGARKLTLLLDAEIVRLWRGNWTFIKP